MIVIVSGFAGCGKSTLAINLGKELGLQVIHASGILKELQNKKIEQIDAKRAQRGKGFWESEQGIGFVHQRIKDTSMDKALDKKLLEIIDKDNAVIDSKTMGYLSKKGIKIWVQCSAETRAERIAERDGLPKQEVLEKIVERDRVDTIIYKTLYGFELGKELEKFDLVLDNEKFSREQTLKKTLDFVRKKSKGN